MRRRSPSLLLAAAILAALPAGAELALVGRVEVEGGTPLAGAAVELLPVPEPYRVGLDALAGRMEPEPIAATVTDDDGLFDLIAPGPGLWSVRVAAAGYVPMLAELEPVVEEGGLPTVALRPDRGLRVLVRGPDGRPFAGAAVVAVTRNRDLWRARLPDGRQVWYRGQSRGWTDDAGAVTLPRAATEALRVYAFAPGFAPAKAATGAAQPIELRLRRGRPAVIEVVDQAGRPVPEAVVFFGRELWPAGLTDRDGRLATLTPAGGTVSAVSPVGGRGKARLEPTRDSCSVRLDEPLLVSGSVIEGVGREPLADALVWASSVGRQLVRTDGGGRFTLRAWPYQNRVFLQAATPGYSAAVTSWDVDPETEPTLILEPTATLGGEVVDERGEPVAGAELTVQLLPEGHGPRRFGRPGPTRSRADGRFRLGGIWPEVMLEVEAAAAGFAPTRLRLGPLEAHESRTDLRLTLSPGASLTGRLRAGGKPVVGAGLRLLPRPDTPSLLELRLRRGGGDQDAAVSDGEGRFEIPDLPAGGYLLRATAPGHAPLVVPGVTIEAGGDTDLGVLDMQPGAAITGLVVDDESRPVAGAEVRAESRDLGAVSWAGRPLGPPEPPATTDTEGRFVVADRRRGERVTLSVSHPDLRPVELPPIEAPNETPLRIVLERGARLSGVVVDPTGAPVAAARLDVSVEEGGQVGTMFRLRHISERPGLSAADGRFEIRQAPSGTLRLTASAEGWLPTTLGGLVVPAGGEIDGLRLVLERGATVTGRVFEADGQPAVGVTVGLGQVVYGLGLPSPYARTDTAGAYTLEGVPTGRRVVIAQGNGTGEAAREIEVQAGGNVLDIRFAGGVAVAGRVLDRSGAPVAGAAVELLADGRRAVPSARSREDGSFRLEEVADGSYQIRARRTGYAETPLAEPVEVAGSPLSGLEIRLRPGGAITGSLLGLEADQLALASVGAFRDGEDWLLGRLEGDGGYRIPDLPPGAWTVLALVRDGPRARGRVVLEPGAGEARLDLDFAAGLALTGQVLLAGEPAAAVEIELRGGGVAGWASSTTDLDGRFRLEGLEPGRYRLEVRDHRGLDHRQPLELDGDRELLVEIPTGRLAGRVLDGEDLAPLAGAGLSLLRQAADGRLLPLPIDVHLATDSRGRFVVPTVAAGAYRLRAVKEGYAPAERAVTIPPGADLADLELRLLPSGGLTLTVTGPTGTPVTRLSYAALDAAQRPLIAGSRQADTTGQVWLPAVPAGAFDLLLAAPGAAVRRIRAEPPGPLAVRLEPSCRLEVRVAALGDDPTLATLRIRDAGGRPFRELRGGAVRESWEPFFGTRSVSGLSPGSYAVEVAAADGRRWRARVDLTPGATRRLDL